MTRLTAEVNKDATEIFVGTNLGWVAGDRIALPATSLMYDAGEENHIVAYESSTGKITLRDTIKYNHYGAAASTAS